MVESTGLRSIVSSERSLATFHHLIGEMRLTPKIWSVYFSSSRSLSGVYIELLIPKLRQFFWSRHGDPLSRYLLNRLCSILLLAKLPLHPFLLCKVYIRQAFNGFQRTAVLLSDHVNTLCEWLREEA
jgi:hypothetical protein